jgi:ATP phosphoribosyltransferase regulatory subunit
MLRDMNKTKRNALLPAGLRDVLPPDAGFEAAVVERLISDLASRGFERVKPPLVEFEDGLLSGAGIAVSQHIFRLMDPVSQRMMGVRADITPQVARIAATRLKGAPRPLRLSYAGEVLRVRGTQLRPSRQYMQVGAELIGADAPAADAEIVATAVELLTALGVEGLTVDLTVPQMVPAVCADAGLDEAGFAALRVALDQKDSVGVAQHGASAAATLEGLLAATGPATDALAALRGLDLPPSAAAERDLLGDVVGLVHDAVPSLPLTLDPVENRGFEYHTGIGFTIFATASIDELGSGGRYRAHVNGGDDEPATGFTLYVDSIVGVVPAPELPPCVLLPAGTPAETAQGLRAEGWVTVAALEPVDDAGTEARRLGCSHVLADGEPVAAGDG